MREKDLKNTLPWLMAAGGGLALASLALPRGSPPTPGEYLAAWVIVESEDYPAEEKHFRNIEALTAVGERSLARFTENRATIDMSEIATMPVVWPLTPNNLGRWLYENNALRERNYDFLFFVSDVPELQVGATDAIYIRVRQPFQGIGLQTELEPTESPGIPSPGRYDPRLLGYVFNLFPKPMPEALSDYFLRVREINFAHEIFHTFNWYWSYVKEGRVETAVNQSQSCKCHLEDEVLTTDYSPMHALTKADGTVTPNLGWVNVEDGYWGYLSSVLEPTPTPEPYNMDLYMMGLIPPEEVNPVYRLIPTGEYKNFTIGGSNWSVQRYETEVITVEQVIMACGEWGDLRRV